MGFDGDAFLNRAVFPRLFFEPTRTVDVDALQIRYLLRITTTVQEPAPAPAFSLRWQEIRKDEKMVADDDDEFYHVRSVTPLLLEQYL